METLVAVAQHRNHYYGRTKPNDPVRFGSSPSRNFREINCRSFQSGMGLLPTPAVTFSTPETNDLYFSPSSKVPIVNPDFEPNGAPSMKKKVQSTPIPINTKPANGGRFFCEELNGSLSYSELWAGPAYSNSPPPSSLPIPKFSIRPKRTVSLNLPSSNSEDDISAHPIAKSAPASPTKECDLSAKVLFQSADSATMTLRRILNLDLSDD